MSHPPCDTPRMKDELSFDKLASPPVNTTNPRPREASPDVTMQPFNHATLPTPDPGRQTPGSYRRRRIRRREEVFPPTIGKPNPKTPISPSRTDRNAGRNFSVRKPIRRDKLRLPIMRRHLGQRPNIPQPNPAGWVANPRFTLRPNGARSVPMAEQRRKIWENKVEPTRPSQRSFTNRVQTR